MEEAQLDTQNDIPVVSMNDDGERQLRPNTVLMDRYLIQDVIGVGGMGSVYSARDLHFPKVVKLVAVKEMINAAPDPLVRSTIVQNFEREANILVTLNHPSIPKIFDFFTHRERSYLVIEYVSGKDLEAVLKGRTDFIPEDQVIAWGIELCDVLDFLHNHKPEPIIFRDMKPSNIMINVQNRVVLVDFGIAKVFTTNQKGTMIGTEGYSPPEQYRGEATPLADIYALGATLHHVLTMRDPRLEPPFTFSERPIKRFNPNISTELEAVVSTALNYNPQDRFKSAADMKDALMGVARKTGALARLAVNASTSSLSHAEGIKPLWTFECEDEIRNSPTFDNGVLYVGAYDNNLYAINAANGEFMWKYATDGGIPTKPAVYDNTIYIGSEDKRLHAVSARSGKVLWTYYTEGPVRSSPRIAEGHIFFGSDDGFMHVVNMNTNRMAWRAEAGSPVRSSPFISNELVYFGSESGDFTCCDFRGTVKWRFQAKRAITASPLVDHGVVFVTSIDGYCYALDAKSGWIIWRFRMEKGSISSPIKVENNLYFGSADGNLYCVDSGNGREIWRFRAEHQIAGSAAVYKDAVYIGSVDGNLYAVDVSNGRLRWKFKTGKPIIGSPVIYNDIVYIGSTDFMVYALLA
jgi:outer membrane protein assembly factor BamB/tRNA A-37 threonylcarbamoyl transferase component Bud32